MQRLRVERILGSELEQGELFDALYEVDCPQCRERVTVITFPTLEESRANWDKVSEIDKRVVEFAEKRRSKEK